MITAVVAWLAAVGSISAAKRSGFGAALSASVGVAAILIVNLGWPA